LTAAQLENQLARVYIATTLLVAFGQRSSLKSVQQESYGEGSVSGSASVGDVKIGKSPTSQVEWNEADVVEKSRRRIGAACDKPKPFGMMLANRH
jgi:hypothetical protein